MAEVYRCFDADGVLLYIGASKNTWSRMAMHRQRAVWAADVRNVTVDVYATRWEAVGAEAAAIRCELPLHNILSHPGKVQPSVKFDPPPDQDDAARAVWLDETRSLADREQAVRDITGLRPTRFTLYRRYGKPGAPIGTKEGD